jgi:hypothetical protein
VTSTACTSADSVGAHGEVQADQVLPGDDGEDLRVGERLGGVDGDDARVRDRRAQDRACSIPGRTMSSR